MRTSIIITALLFTLISVNAYSQLWKQYADSAKALSTQNRMDESIELYTKAKEELQKDSAGTYSYAQVCYRMGNLYLSTGRYDSAEKINLEAKQIIEQLFGKEHLNYAGICNNMGSLYVVMGKYIEAEQLYGETKKIREKLLGKEHPDYIGICKNFGILYRDMGQCRKAEQFLTEVKQSKEKIFGKGSLDYAKSCENLAVVYLSMGKYDNAETLLLEAKQIFEEVRGNEDPGYASTCNDLGNLYVNIGHYKRAETLHVQAKQIYEKVLGKERPEYAKSCGNLASLYLNMRDYKRAEPLFNEAMEFWEQAMGKDAPPYTELEIRLAILYTAKGHYEKAESLYIETKQIQQKVFRNEHPVYAVSCKNLADLYMIEGQYKNAESLYLEAKQIVEKALGKEHPDYVENCLDLANLYWNLNLTSEALSFYTEAFLSQNIQLNKIFQFTSELEKQSYLATTTDLENYYFSFVTSASQSNQGFNYDFSLSNRNFILSSSQQLRNGIYKSADTSIQNKYNNWINAREQLAFWYAKPIVERPDYVDSLEEKANTLEKELTRASSAFEKEQSQTNVTWKTIQQNLKQGEAAIELVEFNYYNGQRFTDSTFYVALLLMKENPEPKMISLFESKQLNELLNIGNTRKTINTLYSLDERGNAAYNLIWAPIERHLQGITKIYFAPAGLLYRISFQALPLDSSRLLSDKYQLIQLNTTASVRNQQDNFITSSDKIDLYGGINYDVDSTALKQTALAYNSPNEDTRSLPEDFIELSDDLTRGTGWQYLPGTEKEIIVIDNLGKKENYNVVSSTGDAASEESIKAIDGKSSPSVLHIATHGFFFSDPKKDSTKNVIESGDVFRQSDNPLFRSGLLFAGANYAWKGKPVDGVEDGILTAYEVSNMYLPNTKLVVLSACETGLGDIQGNEGVYGLQRAFKIAGAQNLVMSLWKVPDQPTTEFMEEFYRDLFNHQSINDAYYHAQTVLKNKYRNEPYKWGAWVLVR